MPDNGQNVKRRTYILFPNGSRVWGRLYRSELKKLGTGSTSIFKDPNVTKYLSVLIICYYKYVIVSADKAHSNSLCWYKWHYIECLIKELRIDNSRDNPTSIPTTLTKDEILDNHRSVLCSFGITIEDEELDLLSTVSRHIYEYKICSSSRRLAPLFVWGRFHTGASP